MSIPSAACEEISVTGKEMKLVATANSKSLTKIAPTAPELFNPSIFDTSGESSFECLQRTIFPLILLPSNVPGSQ